MTNRRMFDMAKHQMGKKMAEMEKKLMNLRGGQKGKKSPKNGGKKTPRTPSME